jgi:cytochrome b6-f complex iron-sulfur subunit
MESDEKDEYSLRAATGLSRRDVLGIGAVTGVGLVALTLPIARYLAPIALTGDGTSEEIAIDSLAMWQAQRLLFRGVPSFILRTPDEILACSAICSHLGCVTKWNRTRRVFFCPCHGARFGPDGRILGGPAPEPLKRYDVVVSQGKARCVEPA